MLGVASAAAWSDKYRGWSYYTGGEHDGFVIPPSPVDPATGKRIADGKLTDCAIAWQAAPETSEPAAPFRMFYTSFDGTGYRTAMARSSNLVDWDFSPGIIFDRGAAEGLFDYGGVTFGCPLYENASITAPRTLRKHKGKYWMAYGAYPSHGYEQGSGGEGIAWSLDGDTWHRESTTVPILGVKGADPWEAEVVYQPNLVEHDGKVYDLYNAKGRNDQGADAVEESGVATVDLDVFPGIDHATNTSQWQRYAQNPVIPSGQPGAFDTKMASDPKVWWDDDLSCWLMFYFGLGDGSGGHADIMIARSDDLLSWEKDEEPLYRAGAHPSGIDGDHAHKISLLYHEGIGYLFYTAVGAKGRGIALLTSKQLPLSLSPHAEVV